MNFESDGRQHWAHPAKGGCRSAGPEEAAEWVDYCNSPSNELRRSHGVESPYDVRLWQIGNETSPLRGIEYRRDPDRTWEHLMRAHEGPRAKIEKVRAQVAGSGVPLAITECHFSLPGRNRCDLLSSWAAGVANARVLNVHERNGDVVKIATLADFCGTRWQVNAVMIPTPAGRVIQIAADPFDEIMPVYPDVFNPTTKDLPEDRRWTFPPASVSALEMDIAG